MGWQRLRTPPQWLARNARDGENARYGSRALSPVQRIAFGFAFLLRRCLIENFVGFEGHLAAGAFLDAGSDLALFRYAAALHGCARTVGVRLILMLSHARRLPTHGETLAF